MKQRRGLLKNLVIVVVLLSGVAVADKANASKLVLSGGAYSFSAENASNRVSATLSGLGSYQIAYRYPIKQNIELDFGFSLLATDTFGGDLSFGFDVGANYFFMTSSGAITSASADGNVILNHRWRPFMGVSFNQRNFQSTSSQYAGFGLKGGTEYQYDEQFALHGTFRYLSLGGPNQAGATQLDILGGIIIQF
ncbi:MAG: hypothetical protein J0L82_16505 [Deltaproteobacteria bacterium]|jgi:hypothetical protein|nr:hypothetical protein [Deltaproteobacteria bacterium]